MSAVQPGSGVWVGTITRITAGRVYVVVGRHNPGAEYGPATILKGPAYTAGMRVIAAWVEGQDDDVIVLGPAADTL